MSSPDSLYRAQFDDAVQWNVETRSWDVSGWAFSLDGAPFTLVLEVGETQWPIERAVARSDVTSAYGLTSAHERCGFAAKISVVAGTNRVRLLASQGASQECLAERTLTVEAGAIRANIETPSDRNVDSGRCRVSGWCFHPHEEIDTLVVVASGTRATAHYGLTRDDVAAAVPGAPRACGFEVFLDLSPGRVNLDFEVQLRSGMRVHSGGQTVLRVRGPSYRKRLSLIGAAIRVTASRGLAWRRSRGRWPQPHEWPRLARRAAQEFARSAHARAHRHGHAPPAAIDRYDAWLAVNSWGDAAERRLRERLTQEESRLPLISIVMPVYNPPLEFLSEAVQSVRSQVYSRWELCIADDQSPNPSIADYLHKLAASDERIRLHLRATNGNISVATNDAAALASGEIVVFLDHDDMLTPDCLAEIALAACARPDGDVFYSDDDKITADGRRHSPQFKPDWSPELLLSYMYMSHVFAVRRWLYDAVGGMRSGFEGSQDHDFALRAGERARTVVHIPRVLYHWRVTPGSTAESGDAKPASFDAGTRAVQDALDRRGSPATVFRPPWAVAARIGVFAHDFPDRGPEVTIIVPTRNQYSLLRQCLVSLQRTTYERFRVLVIDNESDDPETLAYLRSCGHEVLRVASPGGRFNFAYLNNVAVRHARSELVLFLNNDTEVIEPRWLSRMVGFAADRHVGAVGARLLHGDGTVQHAGIVHGYYDGFAGPAFKNRPRDDAGYLCYSRVARNYSAVTAACMLTRRATFLAFGGFDETRFGVAYNDVDYCYRLMDGGFRIVYVGGAELHHHEGRSRGFADEPIELANFRHLYHRRRDPYYSPHLSLEDEHFAIRPTRVETGPPPRRIPVLMCAFNLNWEGAPYSQFELTRELTRRGVIEPVVYSAADGPLRAAYEEAGIPVHVRAHPLAGCVTRHDYDRAVEDFATWIRSLGVRVVYGNTLQTFYAIDAAHRSGLPSIWNPRESEPWRDYFRGFGPDIERAALDCFRYPYRVVFVARATARAYAELDARHNFCVIHNGLNAAEIVSEKAMLDRNDTRRRLGIAPGEVAILLLGTVCERKGQHDAIGAWAALPPEVVGRARLFIVGDRDSAYSRALRQLVEALDPGRRDRVVVAAETGDVGPYFRAADIFLCTSRVESYPRVILEAMAWDLPIVTTPVFGIAEQVRADFNALLYDPGDVDGLAARLEQIVVDTELRERLASRAGDVLATLDDFEQMADRYAGIFEEASLIAQDAACAASPA